MKKYLPLILLILATSFSSRAQYVTIPDATFAAWLQNNGYAGCMNGNQLDTTCAQVLNAQSIFCNGLPIYSLEGIEYFRNLDSLDCSSDSLTTLPAMGLSLTYLNIAYNNFDTLPAWMSQSGGPGGLQTLICNFCSLNSIDSLDTNLIYFSCQGGYLTALPTLPRGLTTLNCNNNSITVLPTLPPGLIYLDCGNNYSPALPLTLPSTLQTIICSSNNYTVLPALPASLNYLDFSYNQVLSLPALPSGLITLYCNTNPLTTLPALPATLQSLSCETDSLTSLPALPQSLNYLFCDRNKLTALPAIDTALYQLSCTYNNITAMPAISYCISLNFIYCSNNPFTSPLPVLPPNLIALFCTSDAFTTLPALPPYLSNLVCSQNMLQSLPVLPPNIMFINCSENQLTGLPALPDTMYQLFCQNNPHLTCLPQLHRMDTLNFEGTGVECVPNYGTVRHSGPRLDSLPLCGIYNTNSCPAYWNISGRNYYDANSNCLYDAGDVTQGNVKVQLYRAGVLQQTTFSGGIGLYSFNVLGNYGVYTVQVDTTALPFTVECPTPAVYTDRILNADSLVANNNFAMKCRSQGFDVGTWSIVNINDARPNTPVQVNIISGDIAQIFGAHCAAGISGQVSVTINGPATYTAPAAGALTPTTVNGNVITWNIADFGTVNDSTAFNILLGINQFGSAGNDVCIIVSVTPDSGDYNLANNIVQYCFPVLNSFDPNEKEVYPSGLIDTSQNWLTYTIRFQNTGTDTALYIYVLDTLDASLNVNSFRLLTSSAKTVTQLFGNVVKFNFPNIDLVNSTTNNALSTGYVQYKIQQKPGVTPGTVIANTASIYFDFNSPVITNTVTDSVVNPSPPCTPTSSSLAQSICAGDTFQIGHQQYTQAGIYTDTLTNAGGCDSVVMLALSLNSLPVVTFNLESDTFCNRGSALILSADPTGGTFAGSGVADSLFNPAAANLGNDTLTYTCIDSNHCKVTNMTNIYIVSFPDSISINDTISVWSNTLAIQPYVVGNYTWQSQDTFFNNGITNISHSDTFTMDCWVNGEGRKIPDTIHSYNDPLYIRAVVTFNGCTDTSGWFPIYCWSTGGVKQIEATNLFTLYPNPANDYVMIDYSPAYTGATIMVKDITGRQLYQTQLTTTPQQIPTGNLAPGVYLITMYSNGQVGARLLVKE